MHLLNEKLNYPNPKCSNLFNPRKIWYSGTSISEGAWDGNFRVSSHSPVIICAKKAFYKIFLPLNGNALTFRVIYTSNFLSLRLNFSKPQNKENKLSYWNFVMH